MLVFPQIRLPLSAALLGRGLLLRA